MRPQKLSNVCTKESNSGHIAAQTKLAFYIITHWCLPCFVMRPMKLYSLCILQPFFTASGHVKPSGGKVGGSHLQQVAPSSL